MSVVAEGDRVLAHEEIVELADAVAGHSGIASGIGTTNYGVQLIVDAVSSEEAVELALAEFGLAVSRAGLPPWPVARVETICEADDLDARG